MDDHCNAIQSNTPPHSQTQGVVLTPQSPSTDPLTLILPQYRPGHVEIMAPAATTHK